MFLSNKSLADFSSARLAFQGTSLEVEGIDQKTSIFLFARSVAETAGLKITTEMDFVRKDRFGHRDLLGVGYLQPPCTVCQSLTRCQYEHARANAAGESRANLAAVLFVCTVLTLKSRWWKRVEMLR